MRTYIPRVDFSRVILVGIEVASERYVDASGAGQSMNIWIEDRDDRQNLGCNR